MEVQEDWSVAGPFNSTFIIVQFTTSKHLHLAINAMKKLAQPFTWEDDIDEEAKPLFFKKNRTIVECEVRTFQHYFFEGMTKLLADGPNGGDDMLRIVNSRLFFKKGDDLMQLLSFEETPGSDKFKVATHLKNCGRLGLAEDAVEAMVISALADARKA